MSAGFVVLLACDVSTLVPRTRLLCTINLLGCGAFEPHLVPQGPTQVHDKQAVHGLSKHLSVCEQSSRKLCWDQPNMKCLPASLWFEMVFCDYCI